MRSRTEQRKRKEKGMSRPTRKNGTEVDHGKGKMSGVEDFLRVYFVRPECIVLYRHLRCQSKSKGQNHR